jgi:hypothetical protein
MQFTHQHAAEGVRPASRPWRDVVGRHVAVEGIAWGSFEKGWGEYVILDGGRVYVANADFGERGAYGKLVRVRGVLSISRIPAAPRGTTGTSESFELYRIDPAKWEQIDRVRWPWLEVVEQTQSDNKAGIQ